MEEKQEEKPQPKPKRRVMLPVAGLVVAAVGPIFCYTVPGCWEAVRQQWFPSSTTASIADPGTNELLDPQAAADGRAPGFPVEGAPIRHLGEVLRFDMPVDRIRHRWPQVLTGLADLELQGYRVPMVSGTAESDIAGSLTYYFDAKQVLRRITFRGTTGDARRLVHLVTAHYGFVRRLTPDAGTFLYEAVAPSGAVHSYLKVQWAGVIEASNPHGRYTIDLVIARPS